MESNQKRALVNCYDSFRADLDPAPAFLHSLYAKRVLTEDQLLELKATTSRESKVSQLLLYLPLRGPKAFQHFLDELRTNHDWLAVRLSNELSRVQIQAAELQRSKLIRVINSKLIPMVHVEELSHRISNSFVGDLTEFLSNLLTTLEQNCCRSLKVEHRNHFPLHVRIDDEMRARRELAMKKQPKETTKQTSKEAEKLTKENLKLQKEIKKLKREKQTSFKQMERDCTKIKADYEKLKKEKDALKVEIETLKLQLSTQ